MYSGFKSACRTTTRETHHPVRNSVECEDPLDSCTSMKTSCGLRGLPIKNAYNIDKERPRTAKTSVVYMEPCPSDNAPRRAIVWVTAVTLFGPLPSSTKESLASRGHSCLYPTYTSTKSKINWGKKLLNSCTCSFHLGIIFPEHINFLL